MDGFARLDLVVLLDLQPFPAQDVSMLLRLDPYSTVLQVLLLLVAILLISVLWIWQRNARLLQADRHMKALMGTIP